MNRPLPLGFRVRLGPRVRVLAGGTVLVGGAPTTVITLRRAAVSEFRDRELRVRDRRTSALANRLIDLGMADPLPTRCPAQATDDVTLVIPVRDRPDQLRRLLASIDPGHRVLVLDDASADPGAIRDAARTAGAEVVRLDVNVGPAAARNAGLARIRTAFVAFVDSDVELTDGALTRLRTFFDDPNVALVAPRVRGRVAGARATWFAAYDADRSSLDLGPTPGTVKPGSPVGWLPSACLLGRTAALAGGFDPGMRVGEDVDLVWRLVGEGHRVQYVPSVEVLHDSRTSAAEVLRRKFFYGTSAGELASRHGSAVAPAVFTPWTLAVVVVLLCRRRWSLPVATAVVAGVSVKIAGKLPVEQDALRIASGLAAQGALAAVSQTAGLALRHWWPLGLLGAVSSRRLRGFVLAAAAAEAVSDYVRIRPRLDPVRFGLARRLDDLAYGAGVWAGCLRSRSFRALRPVVRMPTRKG
ncbi:mycofactocin biosynthesis glycosyltransferase MftF [Streptomyces sp. NPDC051572]|uniref:mycofactocin biosynthesis glycosyltransferase MftF n=1 Tax=unclassified Streptomyces TaxID=2593676 RepID=UPI00344F6FAB